MYNVVESEHDEQQLARHIRRAAMDLLARREHSMYELTSKLSRKFTGELAYALIEQNIQQLNDENLQSDERFVESFGRDCIMRGKGPRYIQQMMQQRGVSSQHIGGFMAVMTEEWPVLAATVYNKKYGSKPVENSREKAKRQRFMLSRGFIVEHINHLIYIS